MDTSRIVLPGDIVEENTAGIMCGNGVMVRDGMIIATVRGFVTKISQLLTITPMTSIYTPNVGDIVVGRISQVQQQRWRVQIGCAVLADLRLSSVDLADDRTMRRRTTADERNMRQYYDVGELVCAEVQQVMSDGGISLHTRPQYPRRLDNGVIVDVPSRLIKRVPLHITTVEVKNSKFTIIYGMNGTIWISPNEEDYEYDVLIRIKNCIILLATYEKQIFSDVVGEIFDKTMDINPTAIVSIETAEMLGFVFPADKE